LGFFQKEFAARTIPNILSTTLIRRGISKQSLLAIRAASSFLYTIEQLENEGIVGSLKGCSDTSKELSRLAVEAVENAEREMQIFEGLSVHFHFYV
jgi:hypothetical protein